MSENKKTIYRGPDGAGKGDKPRISNKKSMMKIGTKFLVKNPIRKEIVWKWRTSK